MTRGSEFGGARQDAEHGIELGGREAGVMKNAGAALLKAALTSLVVTGVAAALMLGEGRVRISGVPFAEIAHYLPNTLILIAASLVVALILVTPYALILKRGNDSPVGRAMLMLVFPLSRIPVFWLACFLQLVFAEGHGKLPAAGMFDSDKFSVTDLARHLVLPACALGLFQAGAYARWLRSCPTTAAIVAGFAGFLPAILSACVLVETIYAWPGEGRLFVHAFAVEPKASFFFAFFVVNGVFVVAVQGLIAAFCKPESFSSDLAVVEGL